jgi:hypothetical protein
VSLGVASKGVSGSILLSCGTSAAGNTGSVSLVSGHATGGRGGSISLVVGYGGSGVGGTLTLSAGTSATTGGSIYLHPGIQGGGSFAGGAIKARGALRYRTLIFTMGSALTDPLTAYDVVLLKSASSFCGTTLTLGSGQLGQSIVFIYVANSLGSCTLNVGATIQSSKTNIALTLVAPTSPDSVTLVWTGSAWMVTQQSGTGVTIT